METLKNFLTGIFAIVVSLILFIMVILAWPLLVGIGSLFLSIAAIAVFLIVVFYIIVLIGHLVRTLFSRK